MDGYFNISTSPEQFCGGGLLCVMYLFIKKWFRIVRMPTNIFIV